ncbi:60Kd inner membrane protein-domain-containing protein [Hypomontagnella monticulosa]|nr:60Kd inner membrane protein-domain-containing protein [Hypomontagnella monticulosa]
MLPSRGLSISNPASVLRNIRPARTQSARYSPISLRHFSQAPSRSTPLSRVRGISSTSISVVGSRTTVAATASGVFAQRSGALRNLSLWPFSSKPQPPIETQSTSPTPPLEPPAPVEPRNAVEGAFTSTPSAPAPSNPEYAVDLSSAQPPIEPFSELDLTSVLDIPEQIGYLKSLGLDFGWGPTSCCQWVVEHLYIYSGMPWWATLATVAVAWRAALFVPTLQSSKHAALLQQITKHPEFVKAKAEFDEATWKTQDRVVQMRARAKMALIKKESGASTLKSLAGLWTIPFSYGMFRLFRAMSAIPVPSLETGGLAWFTDLTVHDPYYILPMASVALAAAMFRQTQAANMTKPNDAMSQNLAQGMKYILPPMMFLCTAWLPAGIQFFFLTLSAGSVVQTTATLNPAIRHWAGLPPLPSRTSIPATYTTSPSWQAPTSPNKGSVHGSANGSTGNGTGSIRASAKSMLGVTKEKEDWKKAQAYEERRAAEEKEKAYRRMEDLRRKRAEKGRS